MSKVDERFFSSAKKFGWKYEIASRWELSPVEVAEWDAEDVLEALARIALEESERKKKEARESIKSGRGRRR